MEKLIDMVRWINSAVYQTKIDDLQFFGNNFGHIAIDWGEQAVRLIMRQRNGDVAFERTFTLPELAP